MSIHPATAGNCRFLLPLFVNLFVHLTDILLDFATNALVILDYRRPCLPSGLFLIAGCAAGQPCCTAICCHECRNTPWRPLLPACVCLGGQILKHYERHFSCW